MLDAAPLVSCLMHLGPFLGFSRRVVIQLWTSEELCDICPAYSKALFPGSVECRCNNGYYR